MNANHISSFDFQVPIASRHMVMVTAVAGIGIRYLKGWYTLATKSVSGRKILPKFINQLAARVDFSDKVFLSNCIAVSRFKIPSPKNAMCPSLASRREVSSYSPKNSGTGKGPSNDHNPRIKPVIPPRAALVQPMRQFHSDVFNIIATGTSYGPQHKSTKSKELIQSSFEMMKLNCRQASISQGLQSSSNIIIADFATPLDTSKRTKLDIKLNPKQ